MAPDFPSYTQLTDTQPGHRRESGVEALGNPIMWLGQLETFGNGIWVNIFKPFGIMRYVPVSAWKRLLRAAYEIYNELHPHEH